MISAVSLGVERGPRDAFAAVCSCPARTWALAVVPAVLYSVNNNLDMYCNLSAPAISSFHDLEYL